METFETQTNKLHDQTKFSQHVSSWPANEIVMRELVLTGMTDQEIAARFGVAAGEVAVRLEAFGL